MEKSLIERAETPEITGGKSLGGNRRFFELRYIDGFYRFRLLVNEGDKIVYKTNGWFDPGELKRFRCAAHSYGKMKSIIIRTMKMGDQTLEAIHSGLRYPEDIETRKMRIEKMKIKNPGQFKHLGHGRAKRKEEEKCQ